MRFLRQLNLRNLKTLWRAIRQEPLDLIVENLLQLLKTGRRQSPYTEKFLTNDAELKVQIMDCRRENGVLVVVAWVLARAELAEAALFSGAQKLGAHTYTFQKLEYSQFFTEFSDFQQQGLIFEIPTQAPLSGLQLQLTDRNGHQLVLPIGPLFLYPAPITKQLSTDAPAKTPRLLLLLHDWHLPADAAPGEISMVHKIGDDFGGLVGNSILCTDPNRPLNLPTPLPAGIRQLAFPELGTYLKGLEFDYLLLMAMDALAPLDFLPNLANFCRENPAADLIYFDEDLIEGTGTYHSPFLKPEYSPELLAVDNYIGPNYCVSKALGVQLHWFATMDTRCGGYDFLLRTMERTAPFCRLPKVCIHLPDYPKHYYQHLADATQESRRAHYTGLGYKIQKEGSSGNVGILRPLTTAPLVSIIIPFKDQVALLERCVQSMLTKTHYPHFEVLLVSNNSEEAATFSYLEACCRQDSRFRSLRWNHPFNYAQLNNWAVQQAKGEILLFLNNDIEVITDGWLSKLLGYLEDPKLGAVGAKLLYPDNTVQHAGIIVGFGGIAAHAHKHFPDAYGGYRGLANKVQNVSACTAACLLIRRIAFTTAGGFDARHLPIAFNDVDLCLEIRAQGYRIVYTPLVKLYHYESISRGAEDTPAKRKRARREVGFFRKKWKASIRAGDPYYHPAFSLKLGDFEVKK